MLVRYTTKKAIAITTRRGHSSCHKLLVWNAM